MKIIVASTNPVKIDAVKRVALVTWPGAEVVGIETESGVSAQPMTDEETKQGSINRAKNALAGSKDYELAIGLEGGVFENEVGEMWNTVWVSLVDQFDNIVSVSGTRFEIPKNVADGIRKGQEMGAVVENVTGISEIKQKEGFIGYMTNNTVTRTDEYSNLVKLAVGIWLGKS